MGHARPVNDIAGPRLATWLLAGLVVLAALLVRLPGIDSRPFHTDEAVNAFIVGETLSDEGYRYRLNDHHGPSLFYLTAGALRLAGVHNVAAMDEWMLRLVSVLAGAALTASVFSLRPWLGRAGALAGAAFIAFSAPFVYYSGIFIHETLLLLGLVSFVAVFWRWREDGGLALAGAGGLLVGLLLSTKETAAPYLLILVPVLLWGSPLPWRRRLAGFGVATITALIVVFLLFTQFGLHPSHALDLLTAVRAHIERGLGEEHAYPWWTYLRWAGAPTPLGWPWSVWLLALFSALGLVAARADTFARRIGCWALLVFVFQSSLPYKTPWLMLAFLLPLALLAGIGVAAAWRTARLSLPAKSLGSVAVLALLGLETHARCGHDAVNPANPLAYSPSSPDTARLQKDLETLAADSPQGLDTLLQVVATDVWPLPWTLRHFTNTGFWPEPPDALQPGLLLIGPKQAARFATLAPFESYELRPGVWVFLTPTLTTSFYP